MNNISYINFLETIERQLGIKSLIIQEDDLSKKKFEGYNVKRSYDYYKKSEANQYFGDILIKFEKNDKKWGVRFSPEEYISLKDYDYQKDDYVDGKDGRVLYLHGEPCLLPYQFYGEYWEKNLSKVINLLKESVNQIQ